MHRGQQEERDDAVVLFKSYCIISGCCFRLVLNFDCVIKNHIPHKQNSNKKNPNPPARAAGVEVELWSLEAVDRTFLEGLLPPPPERRPHLGSPTDATHTRHNGFW